MKQKISEKMQEFIDKVDSLCWEYGFEIYPTKKVKKNTIPTLTIEGMDGEKVKLIYIDGDGGGE